MHKKIFFGLLLIFFFTACVRDDYESNDINLEPLLSLDLPTQTEQDLRNIIDLEQFENLVQVDYFYSTQPIAFDDRDLVYVIEDDPGDEISFGISLFLYPDIETAASFNKGVCNGPLIAMTLYLSS